MPGSGDRESGEPVVEFGGRAWTVDVRMVKVRDESDGSGTCERLDVWTDEEGLLSSIAGLVVSPVWGFQGWGFYRGLRDGAQVLSSGSGVGVVGLGLRV